MTPIHIILRIIVPAYDFAWNVINYPDLIYKKSFIAEIFYRYIPLTFFFSWLFSLIPVVGGVIYSMIMLLGAYSIFRTSKINRYQSTLFYFIVLNFAFLGFRAFIGHTFLADTVADTIGWEQGSPFQIELAFYHLGLAAAGLAYVWKRSKDLAFGLILSKSIFLFGAMAVHVYELITMGNMNEGNIGLGIIYGDLVMPLVLIWFYYKYSKEVVRDNGLVN